MHETLGRKLDRLSRQIADTDHKILTNHAALFRNIENLQQGLTQLHQTAATRTEIQIEKTEEQTGQDVEETGQDAKETKQGVKERANRDAKQRRKRLNDRIFWCICFSLPFILVGLLGLAFYLCVYYRASFIQDFIDSVQ